MESVQDREIRGLGALLRRVDEPDPIRLRLADALDARARRHDVARYRAMDRRFDASREEEERWTAIERLHERRARSDRRRARRLLETIARDSDQWVTAQTTLFGLLQSEPGWRDDSLALSIQMVREGEPTTLLPHAHLQLGEAAFAAGDLARAKARYDALLSLASVEPALVAYAHYKRAWVHINVADWERALEDLAACRASAPLPESTALRREAAKDMVFVHASRGTPPESMSVIIADLAGDPVTEARLTKRYDDVRRDMGLSP